MEKTRRDHLHDTLQELSEMELKMFKDKLNNFKLKPGYNRIKWGELEKADTIEITRKLISYYKEGYAVDVACDVLVAIEKKNLANELRQATGTAVGVSQPSPAPSRSGLDRVQGVVVPMPRQDGPSSSSSGDSGERIDLR